MYIRTWRMFWYLMQYSTVPYYTRAHCTYFKMVILNSLIKFCFIADVREVIKCGVDGNGGESGKLA